jgi:hypothetical protein
VDLTGQVYDEVTNFGAVGFSESLLLKVAQNFVLYVGRIGEVNGGVDADGEDPRHGGGFKVLCHITVNRSTRDVTQDGCVRSRYVEQYLGEGNAHLHATSIDSQDDLSQIGEFSY